MPDIEDLLDLLDPAMFWRAHRSFVVNINQIKEVVPWFKSSYQLRMSDKKHRDPGEPCADEEAAGAVQTLGLSINHKMGLSRQNVRPGGA